MLMMMNMLFSVSIIASALIYDYKWFRFFTVHLVYVGFYVYFLI